ncbi:PAS domain S-box-containing protein [Paenibacillus taihuensis]|uniref:histidine kinase n=1 Tax=Paenibacillus taihuensis TaxID=1156355 RepID=A0A3D9Q9C3_9BACL|nr:MEDS domain-containing protein [Paenibacillus taihuensis]REE57454.1 PAS domain S-box-containing protein [Paenibacillus taihuensis]
MSKPTIQLNELMQLSDGGHILYIYEDPQRYVENAVSFILTGLEQGHHLFVIDNQSMIDQIRSNLMRSLPLEQFGDIHFFDNHVFYGAYGDFHYDTILNHSDEIFAPFKDQPISIRTWAHVAWKDQAEILGKLKHFENQSDHKVHAMKLVSVCAYNGNEVSASFLNMMLRNHEYLMTDQELVSSSLYAKSDAVFPSMSVLSDHKMSMERERTASTKLKGELHATRQQLESFITNHTDSIMILNLHHEIIRVNDAFEKVFGWSCDELLGLKALELPIIPADNRSEVTRNLKEAALGQSVVGYEAIRKTKNGSELHVAISYFALRNEEDHLSGLAVILRDVTEQKRSQELLIRAEKLSIAGELAAGIAHEIRNPLTAVKGFLQMLQSGANKSTYYEIMSSEIMRIDTILGELLMLAKPIVANFQPETIASLIQEVVALLEAQANMCNVQILTHFDNDQVQITCEANPMKQVFINFVKNAIEAMPSGGELAIHLTCDESMAYIRFHDQGVGMPEHVLSKMRVTSEENKGTTVEIMMPLYNHGAILAKRG